MTARLHTMSFPGAMTERGFWLYVWKVTTPANDLLYVGRTGDSSSPYANPPYIRMGQHLGKVETQNALRKHIAKRGLEPHDCERYDLICYGPLFPEVADPSLDRDGLMKKHKPFADIAGALEKALADALAQAGYDVLNKVHRHHPRDENLWAEVRTAFAQHFPALEAPRTKVEA